MKVVLYCMLVLFQFPTVEAAPKVVVVNSPNAGTSVYFEARAIVTLPLGLVIRPDTWAINPINNWFASPVMAESSGPIKGAKYLRFSGIIVANNTEQKLVDLTRLQAFQNWNKDWFELEKVFMISNDGLKLCGSVRFRDTPIRIRSELVIIDLANRIILDQEFVRIRIFSHNLK